MGQLNIHMTPEFERELRKYMKERNILTKSAAIRTAIKEGLANGSRKVTDFSTWAGLGKKSPPNKNPRFKTDDDLWK